MYYCLCGCGLSFLLGIHPGVEFVGDLGTLSFKLFDELPNCFPKKPHCLTFPVGTFTRVPVAPDLLWLLPGFSVKAILMGAVLP